jgi:N-acetyl-gamma-glutamyl-phosphate reductase
MSNPKIFIDGEHGTTGLQIIERLTGRDDIDLISLAHEDRRSVEARQAKLREADIAILCLPDDASRESVKLAEGAGTRFIDASTAHRTDPNWTFGFKELDADHAQKIARADKVANPGCYSTGAIALLRPLVKAGVLPKDALVTINAVSGYTGGGKGLIADMESGAIDAPIFTYAHGLTHKHLPEITTHSGLDHAPVFTPSVARFPQGMVVQVPLHMASLNTGSRTDVHAALANFYAGAEHVRVVPLEESDSMVRLDAASLEGSDAMDLHVFGNDTHVNLTAILDNLGKGASGACVQSLNLMIAS